MGGGVGRVGSGGGWVGGSGWGVQGGNERRIEVFGKIHKKNRGGGGGGGSVAEGVRWGVGLVGGQCGCERNVGGRG